MSSNKNKSAYTKKSDEVYQVICRTINIDDKREKYTKMFNFVTQKIFNGLKEDQYLNSLLCGIKLCGSYADNLKISKPDEFDLVMHLTFPYNEKVIIHQDTLNIGNVFIDLSEVLSSLNKAKRIEMHTFLKKFVNDKNYFLLDYFHRYLEGRLTKLLNEFVNPIYDSDNTSYHLKYRKQGPAHTIEIINTENDFSIDFVPGFRFEASKAKTKRTTTARWWEAILKPSNGVSSNPSFRASYTDSERTIFHNTNQFKNTLRLMKKFRDMDPKLYNLKSYYLKTIFLWHFEETPQSFWNSSITTIVHVMFEKLEEALQKREIRYFWDKDLNLLDCLKPSQVESMYHVVRIARKTLESATCSQDVFDIFLTKDEQTEMREEDEIIVQRTFMDELKPTALPVLESFLTQKEQTEMPEEDEIIVQRSFMDGLKPTPLNIAAGIAACAAMYGIFRYFNRSQDKDPPRNQNE